MTTTTTFSDDRPPRELVKLARCLERWRGRTQRGRRIPEALWAEAARLAGIHGVSRIAAVLNLSYADLQRRVQGQRAIDDGGPPALPTFVPLPASTLSAGLDSRSQVEVVDGSGARLILHLPEVQVEPLLALVQVFLGSRR